MSRRMTMIKWQMGKVCWFDKKTGEGKIKAEDGRLFYVHYSAIQSEKKWKSLKENKSVKFTVIEDSTFSQVSKVKEL
jgi:cold shock CspA family protein